MVAWLPPHRDIQLEMLESLDIFEKKKIAELFFILNFVLCVLDCFFGSWFSAVVGCVSMHPKFLLKNIYYPKNNFQSELEWWAEADLNCRPFDYQSNAPAVLSYRPTLWSTEVKYYVSL